jgi:hypothetical protein
LLLLLLLLLSLLLPLLLKLLLFEYTCDDDEVVELYGELLPPASLPPTASLFDCLMIGGSIDNEKLTLCRTTLLSNSITFDSTLDSKLSD